MLRYSRPIHVYALTAGKSRSAEDKAAECSTLPLDSFSSYFWFETFSQLGVP